MATIYKKGTDKQGKPTKIKVGSWKSEVEARVLAERKTKETGEYHWVE